MDVSSTSFCSKVRSDGLKVVAQMTHDRTAAAFSSVFGRFLP